jgi:hypothetical protein
MTRDFFIKLHARCQILPELREFTKTAEVQLSENFGFTHRKVPRELLAADPFMSRMAEEFDGDCTILGMDPSSLYSWHVDTHRRCAFNVPLHRVPSHTFYGETTRSPLILTTTELPYDDDSFFLLNSKARHCIVNFDQPRFMVTLGFYRNQPTYREMRQFCEDNNL